MPGGEFNPDQSPDTQPELNAPAGSDGGDTGTGTVVIVFRTILRLGGTPPFVVVELTEGNTGCAIELPLVDGFGQPLSFADGVPISFVMKEIGADEAVITAGVAEILTADRQGVRYASFPFSADLPVPDPGEYEAVFLIGGTSYPIGGRAHLCADQWGPMNLQVKMDRRRLDRITRNMDRLDKLIGEAAQRIVREAKLAIQKGQKSGQVYKRGKRSHQASAEGQAPANWTGALVNSIVSRKVRSLLRLVIVGMEYGAILEEIMNRPFLGPAVEKIRPWFEEQLRKLFEGD